MRDDPLALAEQVGQHADVIDFHAGAAVGDAEQGLRLPSRHHVAHAARLHQPAEADCWPAAASLLRDLGGGDEEHQAALEGDQRQRAGRADADRRRPAADQSRRRLRVIAALRPAPFSTWPRRAGRRGSMAASRAARAAHPPPGRDGEPARHQHAQRVRGGDERQMRHAATAFLRSARASSSARMRRSITAARSRAARSRRTPTCSRTW